MPERSELDKYTHYTLPYGQSVISHWRGLAARASGAAASKAPPYYHIVTRHI